MHTPTLLRLLMLLVAAATIAAACSSDPVANPATPVVDQAEDSDSADDDPVLEGTGRTESEAADDDSDDSDDERPSDSDDSDDERPSDSDDSDDERPSDSDDSDDERPSDDDGEADESPSADDRADDDDVDDEPSDGGESSVPTGSWETRPDGIRIIENCTSCGLELFTWGLLVELGIDGDNFSVYADETFAIWWDSRYDTAADAEALSSFAAGIRADLSALGVGNPGAVDAGFYTNVFLHRGDDDAFPGFFGNGTGFEGDDAAGDPVFAYLAYPYSEDLLDNRVNLFHEFLHVFQGASYAGSPFLDDDGHPDRAWFIEAMAEWFQMARVGDSEVRSFENIYAISQTPELRLWAMAPREELPEDGTFTEEERDSVEYASGIRQYSNGAFPYYLTQVVGLDDTQLLDAMYLSPTATPQQYLFENLGAETMRSAFAEWAALNTADFAYVSRDQFEFARETYEALAVDVPEGYVLPFAIDLDGAEAIGTHSPPESHRPGAWAYNVVRVQNPDAGTYELTLDADESGSAGADAHFAAQAVIRGSDGQFRFVEATMSSPTSGTVSVEVSDSDSELFLVVVSMPERFTGDETFGYEVSIALR